jgi:class III poly(R)-hydroxyalkanoic acid synthase PhaE subunit
MDDKREDIAGPQRMIEAWLRTATDFWTAALDPWSGPAVPQADAEKTTGPAFKAGTGETGRTQEALAAIQKTWRTLSSAMEEPQTLQSLFTGIGTMPEVMLRLAQTGWTGFLNLQGQWLEKAARLGQTTTAYNFDNLDAEAFHAWSAIYEKEFKQLLTIPQLGLTRGYQERLNQAADKFNRFQAAMAEFLYLLYMPMEKAAKVMQDELDQRAKEGGLPENPKDYYNMWIKTLEGHYMTLFKSREYTQTLGKTLDAMGEYMVARKRIVEDALQTLPIPTHTEVDELYREIYLLKKRIKKLEKKSGKA